MTDGLSTLYQDLLGGSYDCVDRIVLNAYFRTGHDPGGFRLWWRALTGSDETLENAYLMRLAGRFSRQSARHPCDRLSGRAAQARPCRRISGQDAKATDPFVNHYSFHILDRDWGHLTI